MVGEYCGDGKALVFRSLLVYVSPHQEGRSVEHGETAQLLRMYTILVDNQLTATCNSSARDSSTLFWLPWALTQDMPTHTNTL